MLLVSLEALGFAVCNDTKFMAIERKKSCLIIFERRRYLAAYQCRFCHRRYDGLKNSYWLLDQSFKNVFGVVGNACLSSL